MSDTPMELYAKPAVSILIQPTNNHRFLSQFLNRGFGPDGLQMKEEMKEVFKKMVSQIFAVYLKMMLSMETVLLALELMESCEFRELIQKELEKQKLILVQNNSPFESVDMIKSSLSADYQKPTGQKTTSLVIKIYSIALLYLCHKITDDLKHKFASNVWVQNLRLETITKKDIQKAQSNIAVCLQFDILRPTVFNLISILIQEMAIKKPEFAHFVCYLLELYISGCLNKFVGERNRVKRVNLTLGAVKLACHFLCSRLWDQAILVDFNFGSEGIEKYSRILFSFCMDKENNIMIHEKYKMSRYKGVSKIRIVNSKKSQRNLNDSTEGSNQQKSSGSERGVKERHSYRDEKGFSTHKLLGVTC